ncbi:MAG TPA: hypothetical protein PKE69_07375 [Pyrinomonadaceae bacterium]|nr:hypothetical protein [Pyrinomonadaceae bacterium]
MKKNILMAMILSVGLWGACQKSSSNSVANSNIAKANSNQPTNGNANTENKNTNTENKNVLETVNERGKIKPDANAKLEKGKKFSTTYYEIILPADWRALPGKDFGPWDYVPAKAGEDGIVKVFLKFEFVTEERNPGILTNPRKWLETQLEYEKKFKDEGRIAEFGTLGVGTNSESAIPPVPGVINMRDIVHIDLKDEYKKDKCNADNPMNCGEFSWTGFNVKEEKEWYFSVSFPPGTYEENKPTIDAILNSIKFK